MRTYERDLAPAAWIRPRLHPFAQDVGSVIPEGFAAYARVFHPATGRSGDVRWATIAAATGRIAHREMQFGNVAGSWRDSPLPDQWTHPPTIGSLTRPLATSLVDVLTSRTSTPDRCWFAIWEGWGILQLPRDVPRLEIPGRRYVLARGAIEDAARSVVDLGRHYQSASMWWPADHVWFVSTEIDFDYTYIGGSETCIDAILACPGIEALRAQVSDGITAASDELNPAPSAYR